MKPLLRLVGLAAAMLLLAACQPNTAAAAARYGYQVVANVEFSAGLLGARQRILEALGQTGDHA